MTSNTLCVVTADRPAELMASCINYSLLLAPLSVCRDTGLDCRDFAIVPTFLSDTVRSLLRAGHGDVHPS
jgi:hypothetical protein